MLLTTRLSDVPLGGGDVEPDDLCDCVALVLGVEVEGGLLVPSVAVGELGVGGDTVGD